MIKKIMLFMLVFIAFASFVQASCWTCTQQADGSFRTVCNTGACTAQQCFSENAFLSCQSSGGGVTPIDLELTLSSPVDGSAYGSSSVLVQASLTRQATFSYSIDGGAFSTLCTDCTSYSRTRTFADGTHTVIFRAVDGVDSVEETKIIRVDSHAPRILS